MSEEEVKFKPIKHVTVTYESGWRYLFALVVLLMWLGGIVVVKGGWLTTLAAIFPPYALYEFVKHFMTFWGLV